MFIISQYILKKSNLIPDIITVSTYSSVIGIIIYASIYIYFLTYNREILPFFNKIIIYIVGVDLLLSIIYFYKLQNDANTNTSYENIGADDSEIDDTLLSESEYSDTDIENSNLDLEELNNSDIENEDPVFLSVCPVHPNSLNNCECPPDVIQDSHDNTNLNVDSENTTMQDNEGVKLNINEVKENNILLNNLTILTGSSRVSSDPDPDSSTRQGVQTWTSQNKPGSIINKLSSNEGYINDTSTNICSVINNESDEKNDLINTKDILSCTGRTNILSCKVPNEFVIQRECEQDIENIQKVKQKRKRRTKKEIEQDLLLEKLKKEKVEISLISSQQSLDPGLSRPERSRDTESPSQ